MILTDRPAAGLYANRYMSGEVDLYRITDGPHPLLLCVCTQWHESSYSVPGLLQELTVVPATLDDFQQVAARDALTRRALWKACPEELKFEFLRFLNDTYPRERYTHVAK